MTEKPWKEMTAAERSAYMIAQKAKKRAERAAAPDPDPDPEEAEETVGPGDIYEPDDAAEALQAAAAERRGRLLQGIDPSVASLISDDELDEIEREERAAAEASRKERALKDVRAQMRQRARVENDLISADVLRTAAEKKRLSEEVTFRVNLPGSGAGHRGQHGFHVDGVWFQHGFTYTRPRAVYESLLGMHYRAHLNETMFKTLDQQKPGGSAIEVLQGHLPAFEVRNAA